MFIARYKESAEAVAMLKMSLDKYYLASVWLSTEASVTACSVIGHNTGLLHGLHPEGRQRGA